eukprot:1148873-Prymnesium_polylepis.2
MQLVEQGGGEGDRRPIGVAPSVGGVAEARRLGCFRGHQRLRVECVLGRRACCGVVAHRR